ncbi:MAG TPA: ABC transporter ATP-binding protein, partial [bacterium]|nr:ABC transporter ATP-binding protein [bacterium]
KVRIGEYSKGMMQRVGLAQSLMSDPQLLLLDEPLSGLDPIGRKEITDVILELGKQGKTIFFSSHILSDVETLCDRIGILNRGRLRSIGKVSELVGAKVTSITVEVADLPQERLAEIREKTTRVQDLGANQVLLEVPDQETVSHIVQVASASKAHILSITPRKESLEDYFLREIKEESR